MSNTERIRERLQFGLSDRLGKALEASDISSHEMAAHLNMSRTTISNYINGRTEPRVSIIRDWAAYTGAPVEWIVQGQFPEDSDVTER